MAPHCPASAFPEEPLLSESRCEVFNVDGTVVWLPSLMLIASSASAGAIVVLAELSEARRLRRLSGSEFRCKDPPGDKYPKKNLDEQKER